MLCFEERTFKVRKVQSTETGLTISKAKKFDKRYDNPVDLCAVLVDVVVVLFMKGNYNSLGCPHAHFLS